MRTRLTRPTLAQLWRVLLAPMEGLGADDAPDLARTLAVAGFTGRDAEALGVRVERWGEVVHIVVPGPVEDQGRKATPHGARGRTPSRPGRALAIR